MTATEGSVTERLKTWWAENVSTSKTSPRANPPTPAATKPVTLTLGPFEATDSVLGEGGYAKVVLGRRRGAGGEKVAIKLVDTRSDPASGRAASSEAAIVREVAALRRAGAHANVCQLLGYYRLGDGGACHAMVLEICNGGELFRLVERYGAMDERKIHPLFVGMLAGVRHLHAQGIAHRDLKLENIMLADGVPKICDLGLAHVHQRGADGKSWEARDLTQFCGSRSYCAPEVLARLGYNGYAADVWSLGVCLFGLVSGFFPVDEASARDWRYERLARQQHHSPSRSTSLTIYGFYARQCPLSPALVQLLDGMLQIAPDRRYALPQVDEAPWVHGHTQLPPAAPPAAEPSDASSALEALGSEDMLRFDVEVDVSEHLTRGEHAAEHRGEYRSAAAELDLEPPAAAAAMPPKISRQRAELSVGTAAA